MASESVVPTDQGRPEWITPVLDLRHGEVIGIEIAESDTDCAGVSLSAIFNVADSFRTRAYIVVADDDAVAHEFPTDDTPTAPCYGVIEPTDHATLGWVLSVRLRSGGTGAESVRTIGYAKGFERRPVDPVAISDYWKATNAILGR